MNVEPRHQSLTDLRADAVEGLERASDETSFWKADAEDEDLVLHVSMMSALSDTIVLPL